MDINVVALRIVFAVVASGLIGYEREMKDRPAGFRTHILVCVGATIVALMQVEMIEQTIALIEEDPLLANALKADIGRVVAQVVTGVGFLGAGTIMVHKGSVKGLTTATTIWVVACLGLAIGLGYYTISIAATIAILFVIVVLKRIEDAAKRRKYQVSLEVRYEETGEEILGKIIAKAKKSGGRIRDISISKEGKKTSVCKLDIYLVGFTTVDNVISKLGSVEQVISITRI